MRRAPSAAIVILVTALTATGLVALRDTNAPGGVAPELTAGKQQATPSAVTYTVRADGRLRVLVRGKSRATEIKFRSGQDRVRLRSKTLTEGKAKVMLPSRARQVKARAKATPTRAASKWVRAVPAPSSTPVVPPTPSPSATAPKSLTEQDLRSVAAMKSYFGHQSVGGNILGAIPAVFSDHGVTAPPVLEAPATVTGGAVLHNLIGQNGNPQSKINAFASSLQGIGHEVDVAFMKFCYVDVTAGTNVASLFASYREGMTTLKSEYPNVAFLHVTVPLTTDSPADNVAREKYNALIRGQYSDSGRLFDLAAIESTRPDGSRVSGTYGGDTYFSLYPGYASDDGHLNTRGAKTAASGLLDVIAEAAN